MNHPRQSLQTGRCGSQELIYFIGLCSLITTSDCTAFRFDQSLEPADLLLQFQCGHHGFQLEKKQVSATWVTFAHERLKRAKMRKQREQQSPELLHSVSGSSISCTSPYLQHCSPSTWSNDSRVFSATEHLGAIDLCPQLLLQLEIRQTQGSICLPWLLWTESSPDTSQ